MSSIKIVATIVVKAGHRQELLEKFQQLVSASRREAGNISYDLHQDINQPDRLVFIENWQSQAAIDEHNASAHFQAFVNAIEGKTDSLEIILMQSISD
ncbi:antibiotic biosynthesis monooxygenase [Uruburuella testudinis]|uniref:Antibiotic biosynthesis monooxygenase n=1 Tax=Uruburuella testudinis TaxID=1282863 RepID=A0ABY4DQ82_9NEIS|nr:putative quinol monooxygenase [Uruburuella testudinis]UOO81215.1 antibiotic biosynthesis monooxygenase [Uruburuella testudinis]